MKKCITQCDICSTENRTEEKTIQVIFMTEQNEGTRVKPYLTKQKLDLCDNCRRDILTGKAVYGIGAMGYNDYSFKKFW